MLKSGWTYWMHNSTMVMKRVGDCDCDTLLLPFRLNSNTSSKVPNGKVEDRYHFHWTGLCPSQSNKLRAYTWKTFAKLKIRGNKRVEKKYSLDGSKLSQSVTRGPPACPDQWCRKWSGGDQNVLENASLTLPPLWQHDTLAAHTPEAILAPCTWKNAVTK